MTGGDERCKKHTCVRHAVLGSANDLLTPVLHYRISNMCLHVVLILAPRDNWIGSFRRPIIIVVIGPVLEWIVVVDSRLDHAPIILVGIEKPGGATNNKSSDGPGNIASLEQRAEETILPDVQFFVVRNETGVNRPATLICIADDVAHRKGEIRFERHAAFIHMTILPVTQVLPVVRTGRECVNHVYDIPQRSANQPPRRIGEKRKPARDVAPVIDAVYATHQSIHAAHKRAERASNSPPYPCSCGGGKPGFKRGQETSPSLPTGETVNET